MSIQFFSAGAVWEWRAASSLLAQGGLYVIPRIGLDSLPRISSQGFRPGSRRAGAEDSGR
jgi:hypothetical protein